MPDPVCVRCRGTLRTPETDGAWTCDAHGVVEPLHPALPAEAYHLSDAASSSAVPVWVPRPIPSGWALSGVRRTGGTGASRAVAVALMGPGITARQAELVIAAEEPGVGLGASFAGLDSTDPGPEFASLPSDTKVTAGGRPAPLWSLPVSDRAVYVGEAGGLWLWAVVWPVEEWMVVHDDLRLVDARLAEHRALLAELPVAMLSPHLAG